MSQVDNAIAVTAAGLSAWIDEQNRELGRNEEALTWGRLAKLSEEVGEVIEAYIGATGQNPRKGFTHTNLHVIDELADVVVTGLAAIEHMTNNQGQSMDIVRDKIFLVKGRAEQNGAKL